MIAAVALAVALGALSPSDVGVVFRNTAGSSGLLAACPRVAVVETAAGSAAEMLSSFFAGCPTATAVFQLPPSAVVPTVTPTVTTAADALFEADRYWALVAPNWIAPLQMTPGTRAATWLSGPVGFDTFPSWRTDPSCGQGATFCATDFMGTFWAELDRLARAEGFRGLMLPPFSPRIGDRADAFCNVLTAMDAARGNDIAWNWDAVSPAMAMTSTSELDTTFGFRGFRAACAPARAHPLLVRVSVDGGWQARTTPSGFVTWVQWMNGAVATDPAPFLGLALFAFGSGDLNDLTPAASQLAAFLVDPNAVPSGGGGNNGGVGPPTTPPTTPGSNLGPDRGPSGGCSTGGYGGGWALMALGAIAARRRVRA